MVTTLVRDGSDAGAVQAAPVPEVTPTEFYTKQDMSRWTRDHSDSPRINWRVVAGPGGTMIIKPAPERAVVAQAA